MMYQRLIQHLWFATVAGLLAAPVQALLAGWVA